MLGKRANRSPVQRSVLGWAAALGATILLAGCTSGIAPMAPTSSLPSSSGAASPAEGPSSGATRTPSAEATNSPDTAGKPSIDTLQPALADYFGDHEGLDAPVAQKAARCAVYPAFQELSAPSLTAIVNGHPADIRQSDRKVFGDVVTECETAAG